MNAQQSYQDNMILIGYLYNTLKENYSTMPVEHFQALSGTITRLLQDSSELLPSANPEPRPNPAPEPIQRFSIFQPRDNSIFQPRNNNSSEENEMETLYNPFQTPPRAHQSLEPPPIERNPSQSNVTMTRGENVIDLSLSNDLPMSLEELEDDDDDSSNFIMDDTDDYQEYISNKTKPKLTTKCFSMKEGREKVCECVICCEEHNLHQTLTLGCGHEFCKECVCDHFHHSVTNQPYKRFYACPICRADVKQVRVNYSKMNAKDKRELMAGPLVTYMKTWCK
jgi:hypothetical protein